MLILRLFIYAVLLICLTWISVFLLGPTLITKIVNNNYAQFLHLEKVRISPTLEIANGSGNFKFFSDKIEKINADFRGLSLNWGINNSQFEVELNIPVLEMDNSINLKDISATLIPNSIFNWEKLSFVLEIDKISIDRHYKLSGLTGSGQWSISDSKIEDVFFDFQEVVSDDSVEVSLRNLNGFLDALEIDEELLGQSNSLSFQVDQININKNHSVLHKPQGNILNQNGKFELKIESETASGFEGDVLFHEVELELSLDALDGPLTGLVSLSAADILSDKYGLELISVSLTANQLGHLLDLGSRGHVVDFDLSFGSEYFGTLKNAPFELEAKIEKVSSGASFQSEAEIIIDSLALTSAQAYLSANVPHYTELSNCIFTPCKFEDVLLHYFLNAKNEKLSGVVHCSQSPCAMSEITHSISTSNTLKFFNNLSEAKVLSPIVAGWIFGLISQGQKVGAGHKLILQ